MSKNQKPSESTEYVLKGMQFKGHGDRFKKGPKPKSIVKTIISLWMYFKGERKTLMVLFSLVLIQVLSSLIAPLYIGRWIDGLKAWIEFDSPLGLWTLGVILLSYLLGALSSWSQSFLMASSTQRIVFRVREDLFRKIADQPLAFYDRGSHGDTMSRMTNDVELMSSAFNDTLIQLISGALTLIGALTMMLILNVQLTLVTLLTLPLIFLLTHTITKKTRPLFKDQQQATGQLYGLIEETLSGLEVVQAFKQEERHREKYQLWNQQLFDTGLKAQIWTGLLMPMMNVINNLSYALIGIVGGVLVIKGKITIGQITSFINYSRYFIRPINEIASTYATFMASLAGAERVFELLDMPSPVSTEKTKSLTPDSQGCIAFRNVFFSYGSDEMILHGVSFQVDPGMKVALVGPTGAGKTTISSLLAGFYRQHSGDITLDGEPLENYSLESLSRGLGIVLQDTFLFEGSILNNIRYGRLEATDEEVIEAAQRANAHGFIQKLPSGYYHQLSPGGDNLSSGEKQLISIARVMLINPKILILDEATSSVDTRTEKAVQQALLTVMNGKTSLIIAHRLSTIRDADMILYIQAGRIVEQGTHKDLMALKGHYYGQYVHQYEGFDE
jgi:ATP-binding cassette subfamily B protein